MTRCKSKRTFTRTIEIPMGFMVVWGVYVALKKKVKHKNTIRCRKQIEAHEKMPKLKHGGYGFFNQSIEWV